MGGISQQESWRVARSLLVPVDAINADIMVAAQGAGQSDRGSKKRGHGWWLIQHRLKDTTWGDRSTCTPGAGQDKGRRQGVQALGCSYLCSGRGAPTIQEPRTWCRRVELCLVNCAATTPGAFYGELASILLHLLRGGAIAHPVPATAIPNFLGFAASVRGTVPWRPLWPLPWPHGSIWEEAPARSSQASAQEANLQAQVPEGE